MRRLTKKLIAAFVIFQLVFSPTLFAGGSESLASGQPPRPVIALGSVRGQTHPSILAAVVNYLNIAPEKVKILIQPVNPTVPSGNGFKTYSVTYGVKKPEGDFFYTQSIARKSTGWTFDPIPNAAPKPVISVNQALQGEIALFAGISYESIKSLSSKPSTLGSIQTYEAAYQAAGLKKEAVISREKVGSNDYRYWTEDVDFLRAPFLQKANDAIKKVQDSIAQMDNAVKVFSPQLEGLSAQISADIDNQKAKLKSLIGKLDTLKTNPNISSDLKTRISSFISTSNLTSRGLTDSLLKDAIKKYLDNYKISAPVPPDLDPQARAFNQLKSDNQQAREYLTALSAYKPKILLAKTPLALGKLVFPQEPPRNIINNPDLSALDPRSKIQTAIEAANKLLVEGGDMNSLIFQNPTDFVKQVALDVRDHFLDINHNGQLDKQDLDLYDDALAKYYQIGPASFDVSFRDIFRRTDHTNQLRTYLNYTTASEKLGWLEGGWSMRQDWMTPVWQNSISSFLVDETLKVSLKAGSGTPGYQPIYNLPLAMFVRIAKRENRKDWLDNFRTNYLARSMKKFYGETANQYDNRKKLVFEIWDKYQVLVYYSLKSFPLDATSADFSSHNLYLRQIKNLIAGMATPYIQKFLDVVAVNPSNNRGDGLFAGVVMTKPLEYLGTFVHEFTHVTAHQLGFLNQQVPPGYGTLFVESAPEDFISGYVVAGQAGYEDFAELGRVIAEDTLEFLTGALAKAVAGKLILLEKFLSLYSIFPQDPDYLTSYKIDQKTGQVTRGKIPIKRDGKNRITELTLNSQTYHLDYDSVTGRLKKVTV